jgi:outer membrane protein TolC
MLDDRKAGLRTQLLPSAHVFALAAQPLAPFDFVIGRGTLGIDSNGAPLPQADANFRDPALPFAILGVTVAEPISSIPSIKRGLGIFDIQKKMAEEQVRLERQTLIRDIRQLYYGIQSLQSALRGAQENVRLSQEVERITSEYAEKRQVLDVDHLEAQVQLAKSVENVLDLENQRETLKSKLNQKIGRNILTEFTVADMPDTSGNAPAIPEDISESRQRALAQRPETRQARLRVDQATLEMRNAAATFNPVIAAQYTGIELFDATPLLPKQIGFAGVSLAWEPFTWGRKKHELGQRRDEIQEAVNKEQDAREQIAIDVNDQFRKLQLTAARLRVATLSRQLATEALRVAQKQYEVQFSLVKTVLQAQAALQNANADYQRTMGDQLTARAEYERALGEDQ